MATVVNGAKGMAFGGRGVARSSQWLAAGAVIAPILFTMTWFVLGFVSPGYDLFGMHIAPYSSISQPISGLGLGVTAPFMNGAFILGGLLLLVGVIDVVQQIPQLDGRTRWLSGALLALTPTGMVVLGFFTLEAMMVHLLGFVLVCFSPVLSFLVLGRAVRGVAGWRRLGKWLALASPLTLVLGITFFATFDQSAAGANVGIAGLTQRILAVEVCFWFVVMGWKVLTPFAGTDAH